MNYSDYFLTQSEYNEYIEKGKVPGKLSLIWQDLMKKIKDDNLKNEAENKGFTLINNPDIEDDNIAHYRKISIKNPSPELRETFDDLYPFIVCLKDE